MGIPYFGNEDGVLDKNEKTGRRYSAEEKVAAVRLVSTLRAELGTERGIAQRVALQLGYGVESVRSWVRQADIDDGVADRVTSNGHAEIQRFEQRGARNETRERYLEAGCEFLRGGARAPPQDVVMLVDADIDDVVEGRRFDVWLICRVLQVAPSTYYAVTDRAPSSRTLSDAVLSGQLYTRWEANRKVYGVRKLRKAACRAGISIGRDQIARLMRAMGIETVKRSRWVKTTKPDPGAT